MPPSRDEDLDWLYGRDRPQPSQPEPTRVLPAPWAAIPAHPTPRAHPPAADLTCRPDIRRCRRTRRRPAPLAGAEPARRRRPASGRADRSGLAADRAGRGKPAKKRRPVRNTLRALLILLLLIIVWLVAVPAYAWSHVGRVDEAPGGTRPANQPGKTFLLVGSDSREGLTKAEQKRLGTGSTAGQRTDTIMILYVPPGGKPALISLPRDSYLTIPKNGKNKLNAAYAFGGPKLLVQTVEQNTGLRIDGYLEIGFGGFVNIIDALGGIRMCLPGGDQGP